MYQIQLPDLSQYVDWGMLALAITLAGILNRVVEAAVTPLFDRYGWDKKFILYVSMGLGLVVSFTLPVNIFKPPLVNLIPGTALTGILMGGGANWLHDLMDRPAVK